MPDTLTAPPAAPTTPVQPDLPSSPPSDLSEGFDALEAKWAAEHGPARADEKGEEIKPDKKPEEAPPKAPDAPPEPEKKPDEDKTPPASKQAVSAPKALRIALDKAESELKAATSKAEALEAKLRDAEEQGKSTTTLAERLAAAEKERDEARASLRAAKQETSPDFKEKYDKPFETAADQAQEEISQLLVINPETEEPYRKADWKKDFGALYQLERPDARVMAERMFGKEADLVMSHYTELHRLARTRDRALEAEKASWAERTKTEEAAQVRQREGWNAGIKEATAYLQTKYPDVFGEDPKDPEGSKLLKDGMEFVNSKPGTFKDAIIHRAAVMMYAAAHPRLKAANARLAGEVAELKKTIEELKSAGPGTTKRPSAGEQVREKSFAEDLRESLAG